RRAAAGAPRRAAARPDRRAGGGSAPRSVGAAARPLPIRPPRRPLGGGAHGHRLLEEILRPRRRCPARGGEDGEGRLGDGAQNKKPGSHGRGGPQGRAPGRVG
ncbi:unnamed protein product, partial [Prorocentrum cordatum]